MIPTALPDQTVVQLVRSRGGVRAIGSFLRHREGLLGTLILAFWLIVAAVPTLLVGPLQTAINATGGFLEPPSLGHLLGTDEVGRDVLNLVVHGARVSLTIGILATLIAVVIGSGLGMLSGYFGGWADVWLMRLTDFFFVVPSFVLAIVITPLVLDSVDRTGQILGFRTSLFVLVLVIGVTSWPLVARIVRSQTVSLRERPFVDRARVAGTGDLTIITRHILPNVVPQIAANATLVVAGAIATETALSFIGLGDPLQPSWGTILNLAQQAGAASVGAWWYVGAPGFCVLIVVLGFVLVGNALDDTLNPRSRVIP